MRESSEVDLEEAHAVLEDQEVLEDRAVPEDRAVLEEQLHGEALDTMVGNLLV